MGGRVYPRRVPPPVHVRPTAALAPRALLPGDPGRALALAQTLLAQPKMFNHNRGLWGYTGAAADGLPLTIQSTGMGGPSSAIVLEELCDLGLETAVRVGTCAALDDGLAVGELVVAEEVLCADGTSRALGAPDRLPADPQLTTRLAAHAARTGVVASTDVLYGRDPNRRKEWRRQAQAIAVDMETAALFAVAARRGIRIASGLGVTAHDGETPTADADAHVQIAHRLGAAAAAALID
jgi:uridine phosphorylase